MEFLHKGYGLIGISGADKPWSARETPDTGTCMFLLFQSRVMIGCR